MTTRNQYAVELQQDAEAVSFAMRFSRRLAASNHRVAHLQEVSARASKAARVATGVEEAE